MNPSYPLPTAASSSSCHRWCWCLFLFRSSFIFLCASGCCCWWLLVLSLLQFFNSSSRLLGNLLWGKWCSSCSILQFFFLFLFPLSSCFCWSVQWFLAIMMLLHDCIVLCNWFLVFVAVGIGFFFKLCQKKWLVSDKNPYGPYGSYGLLICKVFFFFFTF